MSGSITHVAPIAIPLPADAGLNTIAHWFSRVGEPLDECGRATIAASCERLLFASSTAIELLRGPSLSRILLAEEHDSLWWDADEGEREQLWDAASEAHTEREIAARLGALNALRDPLRDVARRVEPIALDASVANAASEAAMLALHQHALAEMAGARDDHWFRIKLALFESGRWPLGIRAGRFYVV